MIMDFDFASRTRGKRVQLMLTCICDAFFDDVGKSSVEALEFAGCEVEFPEGQTCCGQPAFNAGDWKSSRKVIRHVAKVFAGDLPVVVPSGSCAAMIFHGAKLAFEDEPDRGEIDRLGGRTWELCDYLVNGLGVTSWPGRVEKRVAFHRSCHSRGTPSVAAARTLLSSIDGLELVEFGEAEQCCGFGGVFSVVFPNISKKMGELKIEHLREGNPSHIASADMGCLLHLGGIMDKAKDETPRLHMSQILAEALRNQ